MLLSNIDEINGQVHLSIHKILKQSKDRYCGITPSKKISWETKID